MRKERRAMAKVQAGHAHDMKKAVSRLLMNMYDKKWGWESSVA